jgi:ABC-type transport system substrate-binding protein
MRILSRTLTTAVLAVGVTACGRTHEAPAPCATGPASVLRIAVGLPPGLGENARASLSSMPFEDTSLVRLDLAGHPQPAVAQAWETRDRQTWTFTLRAGLRMQNGDALTASRVRDLLRAGLETDPIARPVRRALQGIDTPTPTTLVVRLSGPSSMLLETLAVIRLSGVPRHADWAAGPFRRIRDTPDEIDYEPFPATWSGPPTISGLRLRFFPSPRVAWAAFLRNEADVFYDVPPEAVPLLAEDRDVRLFNSGSRYTYTLIFRQRHPILRDARVRQAINLAIDRDAIVRRFFGKYTAAAHGPFSPTYWAAEAAGTAWPYDPVQARALLKAAMAGHAAPIELECLTTSQVPVNADIAAALEAQLEHVGIRLRLVTLPLDEMSRRMASGDFDLIASTMATGYGGLPAYMFWHSPTAYVRTSYSAADAALDALERAASDDEERVAARAVLNVMHRDPPGAFVVAMPAMRAVRRKWRVPEDEPDIRRTLPYWTLAEAPPCRP